MLTLSAGGKRFRIHRFILCARCPSLYKLLEHSESLGSPELPATTLEEVERQVSPQAFLSFIRYLYTGELHMSPDIVAQVLRGENVAANGVCSCFGSELC